MYAVATFLIVAVISMAFTQVATGVLIATGLPPHIATFQARSAFTGAGFTTTEAENVVNHSIRRRVIATTMFVGGLGTPTLVVTVMVGLIAPGPGSTTERTMVTVAGLVGVVLLVSNRPMQRLLTGVGKRYATGRLLPSLATTATEVLSVSDDFIVCHIPVTEQPVEGVRSLRGLRTAFEPSTVLGVRRGNEFFGEAPVDLDLAPGDELVVFGRRDRLIGDGADNPT